LSYFVCKTINKGNSLIFSIKLSDLKNLSIKKDFILFLKTEKMTLDSDIPSNKENIVNKTIEDKQKDNVLQRNNLKSSRGRGSISKTSDSGNSNISSSSNIENPGIGNNGANSNNTPYTLPPHYPIPGEYVRGNLYHEHPPQEFVVETIRDSVASQLGEAERTLPTPVPRIPNTPNLKGDNLSTPSMSSLNTNDTPRFEPITSFPPGNSNNTTVNRLPVSYSSTNNSYNSDYNTYYNNTYYNTNGHAYPVPGEVGYFNPARVSSDTHRATIGLNASNEDIHNNYGTNSVNWALRRQHAGRQIVDKVTGFSDKEIYSPTMPNEIEIHKHGLIGKLKVAFGFGNSKDNNGNVNSVFVKYRDITKRKFVWTIWEKKSGKFESYQDFKQSWDPNRSIWQEIKNRINQDIRVDIEGVLGIDPNIRGLNYTSRRGLGIPNVRTEVNELVRDRQPFGAPVIEQGDPSVQGNESTKRIEDSNRKHKHSHSHKHKHSHKHSHNHSNKHTRSHSHSQSSHNRSRSHSHSHSGHHNHSSRHHRHHGHSPTRDRYI
jgi:hypothetical protein